MCSEIDFSNLTGSGCWSCHPTLMGGKPLELGPVKRAKEHKFYPGRRLVASCIDAHYGQALPPLASRIALEPLTIRLRRLDSIQIHDDEAS